MTAGVDLKRRENMPRLLIVLVLAAMATVVSSPVLADNQEAADQVAKTLQNSGKLSNYNIEVQYHQGTARLTGHVQSQVQMNAALKLALQPAGVSRVVNHLAVVSASTPQATQAGHLPANPHPPVLARPEAPRNVLAVSSPPVPQLAAPTPTSRLLTNRKPPAVARPAATRQPRAQPTNVVAWLKKAVVGEDRPRKPRSQAQPSGGRQSRQAQRVPSSFSPGAVRQIAGMQPTEAGAMPRGMILPSAGRPIPIAYAQAAGGAPGGQMPMGPASGGPIPAYVANAAGGVAPARYDQPHLPNYSWPSYASYPNYAALTYPRQYSPTAWPYIGPFYPYPQVPLGWRKVTLEWDDGWWMLDFQDSPSCCK
jgi:hypothetical protein